MERPVRTTRLEEIYAVDRDVAKLRLRHGNGESGSFGPASCGSSRHAFIRLTTRRATDFVDITDRLHAIVATSGIRARLINLQTLHTTTGIVVNEHEPLLLADFESMLDRTAPADAAYRHDDVSARTVNMTPDERVNGHSHCRAFLLPTSACLNIVDGRLLLGTWQRVFLVELDGPRERVLSLMIFGDMTAVASHDADARRESTGDGR